VRTPVTVLVLEWGPGISFTIAWLRWILVGERRPALAAPRYGAREFAALVLSVLLQLAAVAPIAVPLALGRFAGAGPLAGTAVTVLVAAAAIWAVVLTLRTMLLFPLVALDAGIAALPRSWRATRGHAPAILGLVIVVEVPLLVLQAVVPLVLDDMPGPAGWFALALDTALYFPASAIGATATALAARHLGVAPGEPRGRLMGRDVPVI
jgi:hypothetical protein